MPKTCKRFTKKDEKYIRTNYYKLKPENMATELGRSTRAIHSKAWHMGITKPKKVAKHIITIKLDDEPLSRIVGIIKLLTKNKVKFDTE